MVFVELSSFRAFADAHWTGDELRGLQAALIVQPDAGDLIRGARVIYYWLASDDRIYLVHAYAKNTTADLMQAQIRQLAALIMREVE